MCPLTLRAQFSHYLNPSPEDGLYTVDDPILKSHCHSKPIAYIRLHSWCRPFYSLGRDLRILHLFWIIACYRSCQHFLSVFGFSPYSLTSVDHRTDTFNFLELKLINLSLCFMPLVLYFKSHHKPGLLAGLSSWLLKKLRFQVQGQTGYMVNSRSIWGNLVRLHLRIKSTEKMEEDITCLC